MPTPEPEPRANIVERVLRRPTPRRSGRYFDRDVGAPCRALGVPSAMVPWRLGALSSPRVAGRLLMPRRPRWPSACSAPLAERACGPPWSLRQRSRRRYRPPIRATGAACGSGPACGSAARRLGMAWRRSRRQPRRPRVRRRSSQAHPGRAASCGSLATSGSGCGDSATSCGRAGPSGRSAPVAGGRLRPGWRSSATRVFPQAVAHHDRHGVALRLA